MKSLDDDIRDAYAALDRTTPDGYFDTLAARVDDAIASGQEVEAMGPEMTGQMSKNDGTNPPPPGAVETHDENSGLHDIKEMAQSTKKRVSRRVSTQSDAEEALLASASSSSLAAIALPDPDKAEENFEEKVAPAISTSAGAAADDRTESQGLPVWIYAAGVAAVAAAAVIFFVARGGGDNKETQMAASEAPAAAETATELPPAPPPEPEAPATPSAMTDDGDAEEPADLDPAAADSEDGTGEMTDGDDDSAAAVAAKESKPAEDADKPARRSTRSSKGSASSSTTKRDSKAEKKSAAKPKADPKPKKTDDGGKRSLEDLLDEAAGGTVANKDLEDAPKPEKKKPSKTSLTRSDIQNGMRKVLGRVSACQEKHGETGTVMVSVVIQPDGSVSSAKATGKFRGTPTGDCVASAVKTASFPAWDGARKSFNYPFLLAQ